MIWAGVDRSGKEPDLILLWRSDPIDERDNQGDFTLVVGRMPLQGGQITELARQKLPGPAYRGFTDVLGFRITSVLSMPEGIFIGDFRRGVLMARNGKIAAWTEKEGLSSNQI